MASRKIDFLRHIVNNVLVGAVEGGDKLPRLPPQAIDDIRKRIGYAEEKYKFSAFGGSIENLAEYLRSKDFDELITVFKSARGLEVLLKILEIAKEKYAEYGNVVQAIEDRIKQVRELYEKEQRGPS